MIHTYSVIIQNQKTIDVFQKYQPLFADAINNNRIGVCKWIESGTTIDTALPELRNLTDDKEEWRAVIVRYIDDSSMAAFDSDPRNPYDFYANKDTKDFIGISEIPLVRLTQMLGGLPPLEVRFEAEVVKDLEHKSVRTVYKPVQDEERERAYKELARQYRFDGKLPTSILIISIRSKAEMNEDTVKNQRALHKESESSEFWKRNNYPSKCRFVVYDYVKEGPVKKQADLFTFWTSALLFATNNIDPSSLQAYRLYTIKLHFNRRMMTEAFQKKIELLTDVQRWINSEIKTEIKERNFRKDMPNYEISVPVNVEYPMNKDINVDTGMFKLCAKSTAIERKRWDNLSEESETELKNTFRSAERALDESSDLIRYVSQMKNEDILPIDRFQEEDMKEELAGIYSDILREGSVLPGTKMKKRKKIEELSNDVRRNINSRIYVACVLECILLFVGLAVMAFIPAVIFQLVLKSGKALGGVILLSAFIAGLILSVFIVLFIQRYKFVKVIDRYNDEVEDNVVELTQNISLFTKFASNIASYARGSGYIRSLKRKRFVLDNSFSELQKHFRASTMLLDKMKAWSDAFYLDVTSDGVVMSDTIYDTDISPQINPMYSLVSDKPKMVPLNETGVYVSSPFDFIEKIDIDREELYEDERSGD